MDPLYALALDPESIGLVIGGWNEGGLDAGAARNAIRSMDTFDLAYLAHVGRAPLFLSRHIDPGASSGLAEVLAQSSAIWQRFSVILE